MFVFLWIAFNSTYGSRDAGDESDRTEHAGINAFLDELVSADAHGTLYVALRSCSGVIRNLLDNKQIYWRNVRNQAGDRGYGDWQRWFRQENNKTLRSLERMSNPEHAKTVLAVVFDRLRTLRNLLIHGQISWRSRVTDPVVDTAARLLMEIVPVFVQLMIDNRDRVWGEPSTYPDIFRQERIDPKPPSQ
ncbi:MAG: hypothetical protein OXK76_08220 [Gammaproteobacteria bacterium]|nr:hypothetical protein [Gammaproteobacteria bacterium]